MGKAIHRNIISYCILSVNNTERQFPLGLLQSLNELPMTFVHLLLQLRLFKWSAEAGVQRKECAILEMKVYENG